MVQCPKKLCFLKDVHTSDVIVEFWIVTRFFDCYQIGSMKCSLNFTETTLKRTKKFTNDGDVDGEHSYQLQWLPSRPDLHKKFLLVEQFSASYHRWWRSWLEIFQLCHRSCRSTIHSHRISILPSTEPKRSAQLEDPAHLHLWNEEIVIRNVFECVHFYLVLDNQTLPWKVATPDCLKLNNFRRSRWGYQKTLLYFKNFVERHKIHRRIYGLMFEALFCNIHERIYIHQLRCEVKKSCSKCRKTWKSADFCFGNFIFSFHGKPNQTERLCNFDRHFRFAHPSVNHIISDLSSSKLSN